MSVANGKAINLRLTGPEWDPIFAYAESQGITPQQAAREMLLAALASVPQDSAYLAAMRTAKHEINKIAYSAAANALRSAFEEVRVKAATLGIPLHDM